MTFTIINILLALNSIFAQERTLHVFRQVLLVS